MAIRKLSLLLLLAGFSGCSSMTTSRDAFGHVQGSVAQVSGYRIMWNQGTTEDGEAQSAVQRLLSHPLGANEAAQISLLNNPEIQAEFEEIGISQADLVQAGLLKNPVFAASWRFPDVAPGITDAEYSFAQDFIDILLRPLRVKVAENNLMVTEEQIEHQVIHHIAEVKTEFYTYQSELQLEERLKLIVQADQAGADLAQAQRTSGNITDATLVSQQAQLAVANLALSDAEKEKISTREKLNRLLGVMDGWTIKSPLPELPDNEPSASRLEAIAFQHRGDLLAAKTKMDGLGIALAAKTKTRYLPMNLSIGVDTEKSPDAQRVTGPTLDMELPIFNQGQGEIAKLTAQYRQAMDRLKALTAQIRSEVREAKGLLNVDRDQIAYYKKTVVPLNLQAVNDALLRYNAMQVNTYDLFATKQRELETERDYIQAWRDYWITRTQLEETVGGSLKAIPEQNSIKLQP